MLPQPSQTWQEPAGRILVPQVMQSGESTAEPVRVSRSSALVWAVAGAGLEAEASWLSPETEWVSAALACAVGRFDPRRSLARSSRSVAGAPSLASGVVDQFGGGAAVADRGLVRAGVEVALALVGRVDAEG